MYPEIGRGFIFFFCKNHPGCFVRPCQTNYVSRGLLKYELLQKTHQCFHTQLLIDCLTYLSSDHYWQILIQSQSVEPIASYSTSTMTSHSVIKLLITSSRGEVKITFRDRANLFQSFEITPFEHFPIICLRFCVWQNFQTNCILRRQCIRHLNREAVLFL